MPVDSLHKEYEANSADWKKCRDVAFGRRRVHAAAETYLPKLSHSDKTVEKANYDAYMMRAGFYNATGRTLEGLSGMVFRKDPIIEQSGNFEAIINDLTLGDDSLRSVAECSVDEVLEVGRFGILVDYPQGDGQPMTRAQSELLNKRPHASLYPTESILDWRFERINNQLRLSFVKLKETVEVDGKDEFTLDEIDQIRVLDFDEGGYRQRLFRKEGGDYQQYGDDILPIMNNKRLDFIPFEILTPNSNPKKVSKPPILDLVEVNLGHYRNTADLEHGAHWTAIPTPTFSGMSVNDLDKDNEGEPIPIPLGSGEAVLIPDPQGKASYLEFTGAGLKVLMEMTDRKKEEMATLGARMIAGDKREAETAETHNIKRQGENASLTAIAKSVSESLTRVLEWMRDWSGLSGEVSIELNTDFMPVSMPPQMLKELVASLQSGTISGETFWWNLQRGEIAPADTTWQDELEKMEADPPPLGVE